MEPGHNRRGMQGSHLEGDLTKISKMAGLAHEVSCIIVFFSMDFWINMCMCECIGIQNQLFVDLIK